MSISPSGQKAIVGSQRPAPEISAEAGDVAGALDMLLTDAALGPTRRFFPGVSVCGLLGPSRNDHGCLPRARVSSRASWVGSGSEPHRSPSKRDRRFADPAWMGNPLLRRIVQAYLAAGTTAQGLVADAELPWRDTERVRFAADNLVDALAPSNNPLLSPVAWKAAIDTGGRSALAGVGHLLRDMSSPPRVRKWCPRTRSKSVTISESPPARSSCAARCSS